MATEQNRKDFAASIEATLLEQARRNELVIAHLRALCLVVFFVVDLSTWLAPGKLGFAASLRLPLMSGVAGVVAVYLVLRLRRGWYQPWLRLAMPLLDAAFIGAALLNAKSTLGLEVFRSTGSLTTVALLAALLAVSGAFRLSRLSVAVTTTLAVGIYVGVAHDLLPLTRAFGLQVGLLAAMGGLGVGITALVERSLRSEIGRQTLARFLPRRVVDAAHEDPLALLAQPRVVPASVLVSDLRGFTAWAEDRSPADVLQFLDRIQGTLAEAVEREGGTVDKFMGDGMLATFGALEPLADHADRAVRAAAAMQRALGILNGERRLAGEAPIRIGVGVHSGPVVAGCLGSSGRLEFTVLGDTVNTASRLEALTKERGVTLLVSAETLRQCQADHGLQPLDAAQLRGRREPLAVWGGPSEAA